MNNFDINNQKTYDQYSFYNLHKKKRQPREKYNVKLFFADKEFEGQGDNLKIAKHDAASKAIQYFSEPENYTKAKEFAEKQNKNREHKNTHLLQESRCSKDELIVDKDEEKSTNTKNINKSNKTSEINILNDYGNIFKKSVKYEVNRIVFYFILTGDN